jgi:dinuclear metal center YbgI/SA1388 family protein
MAARTADIIAWLDELLDVERYDDFGPNGLQVSGAETVTKVLTGVSAHKELFERAVAEEAQLVLAHHGILWSAASLRIGPVEAPRLKLLLGNDIALAGYHLPLDGHIEHGNNALIARGLGAAEVVSAFAHKGMPVGVVARFGDDGVPARELLERVARLTEREPLTFDAGPDRVRTLGIVSGGGASYLHEAVAMGVDGFLTGEPSEWVMAIAREAGVHFIAAGHYATETFGIKRIGELVAERFGVEHVFAPVPNPV